MNASTVSGCDLAVVGGNRMDDAARPPQSLRDLRPDERVRPLDLVVHRLADVVQEAGGLGNIDIRPDFRRDSLPR